MKNNNKELDVDFIGGQKSMTKKEELAISEFILANKERMKLLNLRKYKLKTLSKDQQPA